MPDGCAGGFVHESLEVAGAVLGIATGPPERQGLAGEWLRAHELAVFARRRISRQRVYDPDRHAEPGALDLACVDGEQRGRRPEQRYDVRPARDGA